MSEEQKPILIPSLWEDPSSPAPEHKPNSKSKTLTESQIRDAQMKARTQKEAAAILGVHISTYKKYAIMYGIDKEVLNQAAVGIPRPGNRKNEKYKVEDIIQGKHPNFPPWHLKHKLLQQGYMEEKCSNCGFCERRITDHRVPLVIDFIDGDRTNHLYENIRMLCFNCTFLIRGNLNGATKEYIY